MQFTPPFLAPCASFLAVTALGACATSPPLPTAPETVALPEAFMERPMITTLAEPGDIDWWQSFGDPQMARLVERALANNADLDVARANIQTARALLGAQALETTLSTVTTGDVSVQRPTRPNTDIDAVASGQIGASWEYDAFGRIQSQIESAEFDVIASEEVGRDIAVLVAAATAQAYVDIKGGQVRLNVATRNAALQLDSLNLLQTLFENGRATRLDLERAQSQYRSTLASLPLLEQDVELAMIQLATLLGEADPAQIETAVDLTSDAARIPAPPSVLNIGTPEALIQRRPDIRASETQIASLLALSGAERARLFPTLTFNANILALFGDNTDVEDSVGFAIGPAIRWEGPDLRRVRADIDVADARVQTAFAVYRQTVLAALSEIETALATYETGRNREADLRAAADAATQASTLARLRFEEGVDDFLDVIDAQRTQLDAQDQLEQNRLETTKAAIATYRALGGIRNTVLNEQAPTGEGNVS